MGVELVFFYGPPYAGKTLFYLKHYQDTHRRICPSSIFDSEPNITLRCLILKIVAILQKGHSVVLDDENEFRHTRASYINLIKAKVPDCRFICIEFLVSPHHARLQCSWAREWNIAQCFLDERKIYKFSPLEKEGKFCRWFEEEKIGAPCDNEGFEVTRVRMGLSCNSPFMFDVPALIIQIEVLSPDKASSIEHLTNVINTWSSVNMAGRVIFLGNIQHSCHQAGEDGGIGEESCSGKHCSCFGHVKERLRQLALKMDTPLYFALVDYLLLQYQFILPPQPGLIAWIQRLHTIDFSHKSSLYVCTTEAHTKMAQSAGLKTLKIKTVLNNPKIVTAINCRARQSAVPICVSESTVSYYGNIALPNGGVDLESKSSGPATRPSPCIPLLDKARASRKQMEQPCMVTEFAMGRYHGVCFKNLELLEKYQELYKNSASPTDEVLYTPYKPDCAQPSAPSETTDDKNIVTSAPTSPKDEQNAFPLTSHESELKISRTNENKQRLTSDCIKIEQKDIEKIALSEGRYKKGKEIQHLIKDLAITPDGDEQLLQISCTCTGSQGQRYEVFGVIGSQGIKQAKCSCLDSAGQTGQCKHVVAMLLKYVDKDERTKEEMFRESISNPVSQPEKNEGMKHSRVFKRNRKRSKMASAWQNTMYVMSSRELLETANQIIEEYNQGHKDKTEEEQETKIFTHEVQTPREILWTDTRCCREISENKETYDTSSTKRQESLIEDELVEAPNNPSSTVDSAVNLEMNEKEHLGYEETKRQRRSYGKSILDEMI